MSALAADRRDFQAMRLRELKRTWSSDAPASYWEPEAHAELRRERRTRPLVGFASRGPAAEFVARQRQAYDDYRALTPAQRAAHDAETAAVQRSLATGRE